MNEFCKNLLDKNASSSNQKFEGFKKFLKSKMKTDLVGIVLFGSTARGTASTNSDVDLLIVLDSNEVVSRDLYDCWDDYIAQHNALELKQYSPHFSPLPKVALRTEGIWLETSLDGIVLWEENFKVSRFLATIRKAIAEQKLVRKLSHGHPYWILVEENL